MFRVKCPCCGAKLEIDPSRRKVVDHVSGEEAEQDLNERFEAGLDRVRHARDEQGRKYEQAQEEERRRKERLASLFDEAVGKVSEDEDREEPPQRFWD